MCRRGELRMIRSASDLDDHLARWNGPGDSADRPVPLGFILSMEGADPVLAPDQVEEWFDAGLRIIGPAHYGVSPYAHGTATEGGLFPAGRPLLAEMERVGMLLDVTHLADQSFWEAMDAYHGPVLASHHNCRALVPGDRQLADEQIRALIARGAVIGMAFDAWMMHLGWVRGETTPESADVSIERIIEHVDHICQIAGDARHVGIGSDLDGGFGREQSPRDLDTIADLRKLPGLLARRGYDQSDIAAIMHGNWLRFFRAALPRAS
jgi:membrane dipeptidase